MSFTIKGDRELSHRMKKMAREFPNRAKSALRGEAERIMTRSKQEFVPVDLGTLRASGHVNDPEHNGKEIEVTMGYGGPAAAYALAVHEHPSSSSPPSWKAADTVEFHPEGRGPKYLERPLQDAIPGMSRRLAEAIDLGDD